MTDFNSLPAHVWPRNAARDSNGVVSIGGVALTDLAAEYGTPLYVFDEQDFRSRCRDMAQAFGGPEHVHYASKAFITKRIVRWVDEEGLCLDVASLNEAKLALAAGFPAERMTAHGNNKEDEYLQLCVDNGIGHVVLDNEEEFSRLNSIAASAGRVQPVMIRVKPGVDAHTHEFIATAHEDQKFGISLSTGAAFNAAQKVLESANLKLVGLHCHVGSSVFNADGFKLAAERVLSLYKRIHCELGVALEELDLGGGFGIPYMEYEEALDVATLAKDLLDAVERTATELDITPPFVLVEPGRSLVGASAVTVYRVGTVKDVETGKADLPMRRYLSVDGGMSDNIRPALYGSEYDVRVVNRRTQGEPVDSRIVGFHCESGDILVNERRFPSDITTGDLLAFATTGAYQYMMASRYNGALRPAVVSVRDGKAQLMLRRETVEDLLALDVD
ncbi:diaminopimelate decarboxylase [Corynebacterium sp. HMSC056E09]|uniref:diaminopimelate decarboxylase n=2 Tax=Corynebacterium TaxID=1716 RepID=UPI0008A127E5|nr:diaminopimelate decarboxylase [Corynebacterium sp. HMSC056E09]MCG7259774.1 diaminopimelate decarboxylase [Corynebacterium aurimucosum]MDK6807369.1 diaminopimelate decarboxylase [Corynebacterium aurimucosum]NJJ83693.1 diaminopimelate decarboxylase [Corynebacterium aurimucosum]OFQ92443.1 diaminopimelate decarboxylase [Corynebacterium sp. HMSC056E09]